MSIDKRNGYINMLNYIKEKKMDGIVVYSLSRLGRKLKDVLETTPYFMKQLCRLYLK